ncbi:MAG: hypothetical protein CBB68_03035 [Rhodospirillaceae bacterium TMED8]|nr:MAG: hypothetical protein CBB68_03035 [Rhodospirillaceae bacterium TMED8]|tara:strand:+ start:1459 stop:2349 length:891 start_codon:yes stop_codon:yes gene_type:complete
MSNLFYCELQDRGVLQITGQDARDFLQGLISNDIQSVSSNRAIYSALLTPQGKYLFDFFITEYGGALLLETEKMKISSLIKRLKIYKLRAEVELKDVTNKWSLFAFWGEGISDLCGLSEAPGSATNIIGGVAFVDPRLPNAGIRILQPIGTNIVSKISSHSTATDPSNYDRMRLALGLPYDSRDLIAEKSTLIESGFDELHGIDWNKGCYMGQELTARTKYRGLVKKRLVPVDIFGPLPEPGSLIFTRDGRSVGEMRSGRDNRALALVRIEYLDGSESLQSGKAKIIPIKPDWADF